MMAVTTVLGSGAAAGSGGMVGTNWSIIIEHRSIPGKDGMQAVAAIHGFDALVGPEGQCGLLLGPPGFKGRPAGQAAGLNLPPELLSTKAIRRAFGCRHGAAASNADQGSDFGERSEDIALGQRRR